ncbi:MAG: hypothetical protein ACRCSF_04105 [Mycobacteriaceae bacterium]
MNTVEEKGVFRMFLLLLKFSPLPKNFSDYHEEYNKWINEGFQKQVFPLTGSMNLGKGGAILAHNFSQHQIQKLVDRDPFVQQGIVNASILEIEP